MRAVVLRAEPLRRPVGLEERVVHTSVGRQLVLVGVQVVDRRIGVDRRSNELQCVRLDPVVVIDEHDELAGRHLQRGVRRGDDAARLLTLHEADPGVAVDSGSQFGQHLGCVANRRRRGTAPSRRMSGRRSSRGTPAGGRAADRGPAYRSRSAGVAPRSRSTHLGQHPLETRLPQLAASSAAPHHQLESLDLTSELAELHLELTGARDRRIAFGSQPVGVVGSSRSPAWSGQ